MVSLWSLLLAVAGYPAYLLAMSALMAAWRVPPKEIRKWIMRQAARQRFADLIRVAREDRNDDPEAVESPGGEGSKAE